MHRVNPNDGVFFKRRLIALVGFSLLPFLQLKAQALEGLATEESETRTAEQKQKAEQTLQGDASPNPFLFLLNGLGIFSSGLLGALYAFAMKEKIANEAIIESMTNKLNEKEATIVSLEKNYESKLLNEKEERNKQLKKANEEQQSLLKQLRLANSTITGLGHELLSERRFVEDLNVQLGNLQTDLMKADEDKKELEENLKEKLNSIEVLQEKMALLSSEIKDKEDTLYNLNSMLAAKQSELEKLNSTFEQTKDELAAANSEIERLKLELLEDKKELELKNAVVDDLNARVSSLIVQKDDSNREFDAIQKEFDDLKSSSEEKVAADAKLLGEKDYEIHQLKEKIDLALNEVSRNKVIVANLTQERDDLRKTLDVELNNAKNLKHELQITQEAFGKSRNEVSDLEKQLQQTRNLCSDIESEGSKLQAEFSEARESFQTSLDEAKRKSDVLVGELASAKELLKKTEAELQFVSHDLAVTTENRDSLKKELVDVYKKAENVANDLKEEKKVVASLNKELQVLEKQISKDRESRKSLEMDLEEAIKSLDEMNQNALLLSRELEMTKSQISSLEDEKDVLYKSLAEQKQVSQEARENMEDAHDLVMRLGKERESLEKRAKKLEEELALAKGEILRLRSKINSSRSLVNDQHQKSVEAGGNAAVSVKKTTTRRRKGGPQQDNS
ncbi:MAR-binding filament-like protein 1-1 [Camellia lanceoleosa]|uniref:MAR-binding filament-like protein 1-1 n=1 Tax=Camellia lanceoleosa TaxID=1840588 RepID=A0ACC0I1B0_9ERIC|nr:MAR-binding filament-like protein 1-1 [Camellia lanceoleosa]